MIGLSTFLLAFQDKMANKPNIANFITFPDGTKRIIAIHSTEEPEYLPAPVGGKFPFIGLMYEEITPDYEERPTISVDPTLFVVVYQQMFVKDPQQSLTGPFGLYTINDAIVADASEGGMNNDIDFTYDGPDVIELHWIRTRRPEKMKDPKIWRLISEFHVVRDTVLQETGV